MVFLGHKIWFSLVIYILYIYHWLRWDYVWTFLDYLVFSWTISLLFTKMCFMASKSLHIIFMIFINWKGFQIAGCVKHVMYVLTALTLQGIVEAKRKTPISIFPSYSFQLIYYSRALRDSLMLGYPPDQLSPQTTACTDSGYHKRA